MLCLWNIFCQTSAQAKAEPFRAGQGLAAGGSRHGGGQGGGGAPGCLGVVVAKYLG